MNTALGDSFDIGWKLSSLIKGYGGESLLDSYEIERRPVAARNIDRSGVHVSVHQAYYGMVAEAGEGVFTSPAVEGKKLRTRIAQHVEDHDGENKDHGIEMGYRYNGSPVIVYDQTSAEPEWNAAHYIPSTWPGTRAPQVPLVDGETSIFDQFGPDYTIIDFSLNGHFAQQFAAKAAELNIPLKAVNLPHESHAHQIWGRDAFIIRPDDHVAWRASADCEVVPDVENVLLVSVGQKSMPIKRNGTTNNETATAWIKERGFTSTVGNVDQEKVEMLAAFQR